MVLLFLPPSFHKGQIGKMEEGSRSEAEVCVSQQERRLGSPMAEGIWCCGAPPKVLHSVLVSSQFKWDVEEGL